MNNRFDIMDSSSIARSRLNGPEQLHPFTSRDRSFNPRQPGSITGNVESEVSPAQDVPPALDEATLTRHWAKLLLDTYTYRSNCFPDGLFADPAWDMLLDLMHAKLMGKRVSVSSLCIAARVPATTALRRIGDLVSKGLAIRIKDETDGRRVFVELTDDGFERMGRYLDAVRVAISTPPNEVRRRF